MELKGKVYIQLAKEVGDTGYTLPRLMSLSPVKMGALPHCEEDTQPRIQTRYIGITRHPSGNIRGTPGESKHQKMIGITK